MKAFLVAVVIALGVAGPALAGPAAGPPFGPDVRSTAALEMLRRGQLADSGTCAWSCQSRYNNCQARCRTYSCRSSCSSRYSACLTRCTTRN